MTKIRSGSSITGRFVSFRVGWFCSQPIFTSPPITSQTQGSQRNRTVRSIWRYTRRYLFLSLYECYFLSLIPACKKLRLLIYPGVRQDCIHSLTHLYLFICDLSEPVLFSLWVVTDASFPPISCMPPASYLYIETPHLSCFCCLILILVPPPFNIFIHLDVLMFVCLHLSSRYICARFLSYSHFSLHFRSHLEQCRVVISHPLAQFSEFVFSILCIRHCNSFSCRPLFVTVFSADSLVYVCNQRWLQWKDNPLWSVQSLLMSNFVFPNFVTYSANLSIIKLVS